jgi:hypothetical protein
MIVNDNVMIIKSHDKQYLNKKGQIIWFNPLTKKYTIYISSIPIRRDKYILKTKDEIKKIPKERDLLRTHYISLVNAETVDIDTFTRTLDFVKLIHNYEDVSYVSNSLESQLDKLDSDNQLSKIYKCIIDELLNISDSLNPFCFKYNSKYIEPDMELDSNVNLMCYVFDYENIPEDLRIKILKALLDLGGGGEDSIPRRKNGLYLFNSALSSFTNNGLIRVVKLLNYYGLDLSNSLWELDQLYKKKKIKPFIRKEIIDILIPDNNDCILCTDCKLTYPMECCRTESTVNRLCIDCYYTLYDNHQSCPYCRSFLGILVRPSLEISYINMNMFE